MEDQPRKKLVPEDNKLQISARKSLNHFTFLSKIFFKNFEEIELHALGEAISVCARLGERLQRFELGTLTSIRTFSFLPEPREGDEQRTRNDGTPFEPRKKVKMVIKVKRSSKFFELVDTTKL